MMRINSAWMLKELCEVAGTLAAPAAFLSASAARH
jgi:hypothetical protein